MLVRFKLATLLKNYELSLTLDLQTGGVLPHLLEIRQISKEITYFLIRQVHRLSKQMTIRVLFNLVLVNLKELLDGINLLLVLAEKFCMFRIMNLA